MELLTTNTNFIVKKALLFPKMELKILPKLSEEERNKKIDEIIDKGEYLNFLYQYAGDKFTPQQIDKAIDKGKDLYFLYKYTGENFTPQQIDKAIKKGEELEYLYYYVGTKFTPEQKKKYVEKTKKKTSSRTCKRIVFMNL